MEPKQRHGCVTAWLILMIIVNSLTAFAYFLMTDSMIELSPNPISYPTVYSMGIIGALNAIFSFVLLKYKKWAFWGFLVTSIITLGINLSNGNGIGSSLLGLLGILILFGILQIKQDGKSTWELLD